ncbi:hypothetical protein ACFY5F_44070 [Streptomyces sp. NPDC013161]|uniref:hypothetical protein n=1 Tax=Streptomyces sp. NPDC013161 TaxID=3364862 RepID=UPI0036B670E6
MAWRSEEFGESHEGIVGAVLADGSEPKSVYLDVGSGSSMYETREWWAYNGWLGRPRAAAWRASCACGWRGDGHPIDWDQVEDHDLDDLDTSGAYDEWWEHIHAVERRTVPLPEELSELIEQLEERLDALSDAAPVAALKAVAILERLAARVGKEAAYGAQADDVPGEALGKALGLSVDRARSRLDRYLRAYS